MQACVHSNGHPHAKVLVWVNPSVQREGDGMSRKFMTLEEEIAASALDRKERLAEGSRGAQIMIAFVDAVVKGGRGWIAKRVVRRAERMR